MAKRRPKRDKNKLKHLQKAAAQRRQHLSQQASSQPTALAQNLALLSDREGTPMTAIDQVSATAPKETTAVSGQAATSVTRETSAQPTSEAESQVGSTAAPDGKTAVTHPDTEKSNLAAVTADSTPQTALLAQVKKLINQQKLQPIPNSQLDSAALKKLLAALPLPLPESYQQILLKFGALYGFGYFFAGYSKTNVAADLIYLNQAARHDFLTNTQKQQLLLFAASERHFLAFAYGQAGQPQIVRGTQQQITTIAPDLATLIKQLTT